MPNHVHMLFIPIVKRLAESLPGDLSESGDSLYSRSERNSVSLSIRAAHTEHNSLSRQTDSPPYRVTKILENLKKFTAGKCNKLLHRTGPFWQHESYDHVIRDSDELKRIVKYVLNNPVKAGLAESPEEFVFNYVNYELIPAL